MRIEMTGIDKSFGTNQVLKNAGEAEKAGIVFIQQEFNVLFGLAAVRSGKMAATIAQKPDLMGQTAVETAIKLISGEQVEKSIPVEVELVTKDNVAEYLK